MPLMPPVNGAQAFIAIVQFLRYEVISQHEILILEPDSYTVILIMFEQDAIVVAGTLLSRT